MVPDWNTVCILWRLHSLYWFFMILHAHFIACENGCPLSWKTFFTADVLTGNKWKAVGAVNNINPQTHGLFSQYYFISSSDPRHVWGRYKPYNKSEPLATFSEFRIKQWVSHSGKFKMIYTKEKKSPLVFQYSQNIIRYIMSYRNLLYLLKKRHRPKHESVIQQSLITVTC